MKKPGFIKIASVQTLAVATSEGASFVRTAAYKEDGVSEFLSGRKAVDLMEKLAMLADEYDISANPGDYIFEAIRGNTANIPNENEDAFHKHELLRFDHRLGKQVYRTYENKPHHINHRAENPKNARGFIVDAHYNDTNSPLEECPNCHNKTASEEGRDPGTGIHCRKCGTIVKDEFVELLVAIDIKKDPSFAHGVKSGILKHGSMGCSCLRTRCNTCGNVAYTRGEFCRHIAKFKGKSFDDSEPDFNPIAFVIEQPKDKTAGKPKRIAKSFEWCEGVVFDEYSRVHDPADIKAEQYEILQLSTKVAQLEKDDKFRNESEILMLQARLTQLEKTIDDKIASIQKVAQVTPPAPGPAPMPGEEEMGLPPVPEAVSGMVPEMAAEEQGITINVNVDGKGVEVEQGPIPSEEIPIEELTPEEMGLTPAGPGEELSPEAAGLALPPPRRGSQVKNQDSGGPSMLRFAGSYKHLQAEITDAKNIRIFDNEGTLFVVKPISIPSDSKVAGKGGQELAKEVLTMIAEHGIGGTIRRTNAIVGPRLAQVLDYHINDMLNEERGETQSVMDEAESDTTEKRTRDKKTETATGLGDEGDRQDKHDTKEYKSIDVLTERETDLEDEQHDRDPGSLSVTEMHDSDKRDDRPDWSLSQSALDDVVLDHKEKAAAKKCDKCGESKCSCAAAKEAKGKCKDCKCDPCTCDKKKSEAERRTHANRIETLFTKRLDVKIAEIEKEKKDFFSTFTDRFIRAMKIVARRQSLNLEHSPLKEAMTEALISPRPVGNGYDYEPMDADLAVRLVEASINEPLVDGTDKPAWEAHIDGIIERTADVMKMNDESLMQAEADLQNMTAMNVPTEPVPHARQASQQSDPDFRQQVSAGNLQLASTSSDQNIQGSPQGKREAIRQAVGTTKVATSRSGYGI